MRCFFWLVRNPCAAAMLVSLFASMAHAADLVSVYNLAAATNPTVAEARALLRASESERSIAKSGLTPKLDLAGNIAQSRIDLEGFGPEHIEETYTPSSYSATLTQPLIVGQNWSTLSAASAQVRSSEAAVVVVQQDLIIRVADAYFGVLRAEANQRAAESQQDALKTTRDQASKAYEVGAGDVISVEESQARLDAAESDLVRAQNAVRIAQRELERLTHQPVGDLADLETLEPQGPVPDRMEDWVETALESQPSLEKAREELQSSRDLITAAGRERWPVVSLMAEYSDADGQFAPDIKRKEGFVGVAAAWPLYQGGGISASRRKAEALAEANQHGLEDLRDQVRLQTEKAFLTLEDSVRYLVAAERSLQSATTSMNATKKGFEIGSRSLIDHLDSVREQTAAQARYNMAVYDQVMARLSLKSAAGILTEQDLESVNNLLAKKSVDEVPQQEE